MWFELKQDAYCTFKSLILQNTKYHENFCGMVINEEQIFSAIQCLLDTAHPSSMQHMHVTQNLINGLTFLEFLRI